MGFTPMPCAAAPAMPPSAGREPMLIEAQS